MFVAAHPNVAALTFFRLPYISRRDSRHATGYFSASIIYVRRKNRRVFSGRNIFVYSRYTQRVMSRHDFNSNNEEAIERPIYNITRATRFLIVACKSRIARIAKNDTGERGDGRRVKVAILAFARRSVRLSAKRDASRLPRLF